MIARFFLAISFFSLMTVLMDIFQKKEFANFVRKGKVAYYPLSFVHFSQPSNPSSTSRNVVFRLQDISTDCLRESGVLSCQPGGGL